MASQLKDTEDSLRPLQSELKTVEAQISESNARINATKVNPLFPHRRTSRVLSDTMNFSNFAFFAWPYVLRSHLQASIASNDVRIQELIRMVITTR